MKDKDFLQWLYGRLVHVHNENVNMDYMLKLQSIIDNMDSETLTPNVVYSSINGIEFKDQGKKMFGYMSEAKSDIQMCDTIEPNHRRKFDLRDMPEAKKNKDDIFHKNSI